MARITSMVVYDSKMFNVGHNIRRWADRVQIRYTANAIEEAPVQKGYKPSNRKPPGHLKSSISGDVKRVGVRRLSTTINVNVNYATYVIRGTGGALNYITAKNPSRPMRVPTGYGPPAPGGPVKGQPGFWVPRMTVRGQKANNFLDRAHAKTAMRHPSLRRATLTNVGFRRTGALARP